MHLLCCWSHAHTHGRVHRCGPQVDDVGVVPDFARHADLPGTSSVHKHPRLAIQRPHKYATTGFCTYLTVSCHNACETLQQPLQCNKSNAQSLVS
eukprot:359194-Chlamydomonas_euryale.AAC.17